jgi:purine-binding chemotaxis protein CheW
MTGRLSWQEASSSRAQLGRTLDAGGSAAPERVERILRERAQALAKPLEEAPVRIGELELLVFSLAPDRFGIETAHILEVVPLPELTPVPHTPPFVLGVVNHRGRILPVLDLPKLFQLPARAIAERVQVVAVSAGGMSFGIVADAVVGTVRVAVEDLAAPPVGATGDHQGVLRGVTEGLVAVLDLEALARDRRILVNEEAS